MVAQILLPVGGPRRGGLLGVPAGPFEGPASVDREPAPAAGPPQDSDERGSGPEAGKTSGAGERRIRDRSLGRSGPACAHGRAATEVPELGATPRARRRRSADAHRPSKEQIVPGSRARGRPGQTAEPCRRPSGSEEGSRDPTSERTAGTTRGRSWVRSGIGRREEVLSPLNERWKVSERGRERSLARLGHGAVPLRRCGRTFPGVVAENRSTQTVFEPPRRAPGTPPREAFRAPGSSGYRVR
jgi:hypothetical protein